MLRRTWFLSSLLLLFMLRSISYAGTVALPQTGQTKCYDSSGNVISCTDTADYPYVAGEDGALLMGVTWPSPRFTDNGDQTQTDNLTGLIWPKDGSTPTVSSCTGGLASWQGALTY